ncbi:hypothetical protein [Moorena sp. SIO3E8]|uniref:hypothetical protein n=1 Tax=Moorena sp. SIO3E8 TaxID=2607830 RepID=UPI0013FF9349|nr:hypothetical protein [Moorena sp. SIO3E8]NEQ02109.1 hypothetical protein [Moorena sp. SIO3F7]
MFPNPKLPTLITIAYSVSRTHEVHIIFYLFPLPFSLLPAPCSLLPAPFSYKSYVHNSNKNAISLLSMRYFQGVKNNGTRLFTEPSLELD